MPYAMFDGKRIYYEITGSGPHKLVLLHGNTASSRMFLPVLAKYRARFAVLLVDFLGHGKSDRVAELPRDLWFSEAEQTAALLDQIGWDNAFVIGSSGGALAALNLALERPDLVRKLIADSFEGEAPLAGIVAGLEEERARAKEDPESLAFWKSCHGQDWEHVVDCDTRAVLLHQAGIGCFFHQELSGLVCPVLLTASLADEFAALVDFKAAYTAMLRKLPRGKAHFFEQGGHPAMLSNATAFAQVAQDFLLEGSSPSSPTV